MKRRDILAGIEGSMLMPRNRGRATDKPLRFGVLADMAGGASAGVRRQSCS